MYSENMKLTETAGGFKSAAIGFFRGVLIAAVFTLLSFTLFSALLSFTGLSENTVPVIAIGTEGLGASISGFFTARGAKSRGAFSGLISGLLYILFIWVIAILAGNGVVTGRHYLTMLILSALFGAIGGIAGVNVKKSNTNRRKGSKYNV